MNLQKLYSSFHHSKLRYDILLQQEVGEKKGVGSDKIANSLKLINHIYVVF